jgi:hypothetical protein
MNLKKIIKAWKMFRFHTGLYWDTCPIHGEKLVSGGYDDNKKYYCPGCHRELMKGVEEIYGIKIS